MREGLELVREGGGPRYYLDGTPLHAGDAIEVRFPGVQAWTVARYEYSLRGGVLRPFVYFDNAEGEECIVSLLECEDVRLRGDGRRYTPALGGI